MNTENVEPKITSLRHTYVEHGLERLAQFGLGASIWNRFRFDDQFATEVVKLIKQMNKETPGDRFVGKFSKSYNRFELSELLQERGVTSLKDYIIRNLCPVPKDVDQPSLPLISDVPYKAEWFTVDLGFKIDEDGARLELDLRDLVPANTEDGLSFMLVHAKAAVGKPIIVLNSYTISPNGEKEFLTLGQSGLGFPMVYLSIERHLLMRDRALLLGKRKPLEEPVVEAEPDRI